MLPRREALSHRAQAEISGNVVSYVEPDVVVGELQNHSTRVALHLCLHFIRAGVLDGIVESILDNTVGSLFRFQRNFGLLAEGSFDFDSVPGLSECLEEGIDVLDVGCGSGRAMNLLARTFPNSRFTGYDISEEAIARALSPAPAPRPKSTAPPTSALRSRTWRSSTKRLLKT